MIDEASAHTANATADDLRLEVARLKGENAALKLALKLLGKNLGAPSSQTQFFPQIPQFTPQTIPQFSFPADSLKCDCALGTVCMNVACPNRAKVTC